MSIKQLEIYFDTIRTWLKTYKKEDIIDRSDPKRLRIGLLLVPTDETISFPQSSLFNVYGIKACVELYTYDLQCVLNNKPTCFYQYINNSLTKEQIQDHVSDISVAKWFAVNHQNIDYDFILKNFDLNNDKELDKLQCSLLYNKRVMLTNQMIKELSLEEYQLNQAKIKPNSIQYFHTILPAVKDYIRLKDL